MTAPDGLTVSAAVITRNRAELLARTLRTVLQQDIPKETFEVIVIDDGSTDGTEEIVNDRFARRRVRVIRQAPRGVAAARNAAIDVARGTFVVFLDDDLLCDPGLLRAHANAHMRVRRPLIVVGQLGVAAESTAGPVASWLAGAAAAAHARRSQGVTLGDAFVAANCSVSAELLRSCGGFDESFVKAREEHELGLRLVRAGASPFYEPNAIAREVVRKAAGKLLSDAYAVGRDEVRLCRSYPEYRRYSPLARLAEGPGWKRGIRKLTTHSRLIHALGLALPGRLASAIDAKPARNIAAAFLGARYGVAFRSGAVSAAGSWGLLVREFGQRLPVLCFHRVGPPVEGANPQLTVAAPRFAAQIRMLRRLGYRSIAPRAWLAWCRTAEPLPERPILLTFDDAYSDLVRYAFPVLADNGLGATLFAPSACLGEENTWDEALREGSHPVPHRLLEAADLALWRRRGIEIGAHSRTHARLTALSSADATVELAGSREELQQMVDAPVTTFAYPFGAVDDRVRDLAGDTFDTAFTIEEGVNTLGTDLLLLRRSVVQPSDTTLDLLFRVSLGWSPLHRIRLRLRRRLGR